MTTGTSARILHNLPTVARLADPDTLPSALVNLHRDPLLAAVADLSFKDYEGSFLPGERRALVERIAAHPPPPPMRDFPAALRAAMATLPEPVAIGRLIAAVVDTRTGYKPANVGLYVASVAEALSAAGFGLAVVSVACAEIRRTDPEEFGNRMPSEFHFLEACKRARKRIVLEANVIERAITMHDAAKRAIEDKT
jgi:hypothetical protein